MSVQIAEFPCPPVKPPNRRHLKNFPNSSGFRTLMIILPSLPCTPLNEVGIVYDVIAIADLPESLKTLNPKWRIRPCRILVATEDESDARELVEPFPHRLPDRE
jgi:hypothetical protein